MRFSTVFQFVLLAVPAAAAAVPDCPRPPRWLPTNHTSVDHALRRIKDTYRLCSRMCDDAEGLEEVRRHCRVRCDRQRGACWSLWWWKVAKDEKRQGGRRGSSLRRG
ncbi:hypothetical protein MAPG_08589 [Magnaporthiopsis poae ATCC 64411]|uniref:Uncharacterized protein n=1 Tax=Magnaporthiopsis poae (strain ATCC 64411 / 73-15) TaxID=644358 RepID=A0A0C4E7R9_MAGP6|nr:hypothetical protein MAPG_08589 [Magnaporthiopsis poae ATCC 64411]